VSSKNLKPNYTIFGRGAFLFGILLLQRWNWSQAFCQLGWQEKTLKLNHSKITFPGSIPKIDWKYPKRIVTVWKPLSIFLCVVNNWKFKLVKKKKLFLPSTCFSVNLTYITWTRSFPVFLRLVEFFLVRFFQIIMSYILVSSPQKLKCLRPLIF